MQLKTAHAKPSVVFFCGSGYVFGEIFCPLIQELKGVCRMTILIADSYLSPSTIMELGALKEKGAIEDFLIVRLFREKETLSSYHRRLNRLAHSLRGLKADMVVVDTDYHIGARYILSSFAATSTQKVVLQSGTIRYVLEACQKQGRGIVPPYDNKPKDLLWPLRALKKKAREVLWNFKQWQNFYLFPYWVRREVFPLTGYERLRFAAGVCKDAICYDPLEQEAVQATNPLLKNVYLALHPMDTGPNGVGEKRGEETGKLLVVFAGNLGSEMGKEKIGRWVTVIKEVVQLKRIQEIHLRFHPRLSPALQWPKAIITEVKKLGCVVHVVDIRNVSFSENLHLYDGMIGAPSGALRVARAVNRSMFIVGLPNCSDGDVNDQSWMLGAGEGIQWVEGGKPLAPEQLESSAVFNNDRRPMVSHILLNLLGVH